MTFECINCKQEKPSSDYQLLPSGKPKWRWCRSCRNTRMKAYHRATYKYSRKGLTKLEFEKLLEDQDRSCAICRTKEPGGRSNDWHIDHDRSCCDGELCCGKCVRGLLCMRCNMGIGLLGDSIDNLKAAISYLGKPGS